MRREKMSKVLSLLLALTMVISLLPQAVIFAAAESDAVTFGFSSAKYYKAFEDTSVSSLSDGDVATKLADYFKGDSYSRNWRFFAQSWSRTSGWCGYTGGNGLYFRDGTYGDWFALKVKGFAAGTYDISAITYPQRGCVWGLYVLDNSIYGNADADTITTAIESYAATSGVEKIGEIDLYGKVSAGTVDASDSSAPTVTNSGNWAVSKFGNAAFNGDTKTEHILVFRAEREGVIDEGDTAPSQNTERYISLFGLTFEKVEALKEITGKDISAVVGEEITAELSWISTSGTAVAGEKVIEKIEVAENDGAVIEASDGTLYAVAPGKATLKVTGRLASGLGGSKTAEIKITVSESTRTFTGEIIDFNFSISAIKASGETPVYYTAAEGCEKENTYVNIRKMTEYCKTSSPARNWKTYIETTNKASYGYAYMNSSATFIQVPSVDNGFASFKLTGIPKGNYAIKMAYNYQGRGALLGAYILDNDKYGSATEAEIRTAVANGGEGVQSVGRVDCYGTKEAVNPTYTFGRADFSGDENSEYILVINFEGAGTLDEGETSTDNGSKPYMFFSKIILDGTYVESVDTVIEASELGVDENTSIVVTSGKWNDGESIDDMAKLGYVNYAVVEGSDVVELGSDGKTLTTKKEGTAVIETTAFANGVVIRDRDTITVDAKYNIASVAVSGNTTAYTGRAFRIVPVAKMGDGSESIPVGAVVSYEIVSGGEYVTADGDTLIAGMSTGSAKVRAKLEYRGKTIKSDVIEVTVTDELEALSGESFTADLGGLTFAGAEGEVRTTVISVPKSGRYQLTLNAELGKAAGTAEIYAIPYSEAALQNPKGFCFGAYKLGEADLYGNTETLDITLSDAVFDADGDYVLAVVISGKNADSTGMKLELNALGFDGESVIDKAVTEVASSRLGAGETTEFTVSAYLSNGREIAIDEAEISYVYDESLITVDGDKLTIRTSESVAESTAAELTVKVTYKGFTAEQTVQLLIDKKYGVNTDKPAILYGSTVFSIGNTVAFTPAIVLNDQSVVQITDGEIVYKIEENDDDAVEFEDDGRTLKAVMAGTAVVSATVEFRGNVYESEKISVSVTANQNENPNIDMYFTQTGTPGESLQYLTDVAAYSANRKWKLQAVAGRANSLQFAASYGQFVFDPAAEDKYIALLINLPGAGKYNITAQSNYCRYRSGRFDMYIVPATSANVGNIMGNVTPSNFVGYMDFYMPGQGTVGEVVDVSKGYEFTSGGEYLVILNLVPGQSAALNGGVIKAERGDTMYPTYISFTEVNAMASAEFTAEKTVLAPGETTDISVSLKTVENLPIDVSEDNLNVTYRSTDTSVATVDEDGIITGVSEGSAEIRGVVSYGGITKNVSLPITVSDSSELLGIELSAGDSSIYVYGSTNVSLKARMGSTNIITIPEEYITWSLSDPTLAEIEGGYITGKDLGSVTVTATVSDNFKAGASSIELSPVIIEIVWDATVDPAIYTLEERENAKNNAARYSWAKSQVETAVDNADKYLASFDTIYAMLSPEGIPRCRLARHTYDPNVYNCGYCGYDIGTNVSIYGWSADPIARPWKIQCPDCKRLFPSNDFGSFYKLGLSESTTYWNYLDALQKHHELFVCEDVKNGGECSHTAPAETAPEPGSTAWIAADPRDAEWYEYYGYGVKGGYLTNDIYNEMDAGWGVDDGFGYRQKYVSTPGEIGYHKLYYNDGEGYARYNDGTHDGPVQHTYIAYYLHEAVWFGGGGSKSAYVVRKALTAFRDAFLYTGEAKYARAGAIMLDRVADIYPAFDWYQWSVFRGDAYRGKITDPAWSHHLDELFASCYDAFLPIYNDRQVIETLSKRALYKMDENGNYVRDKDGNLIIVNAKDTPGALRKNVEDGILLETFKSAKEWEVAGNFGSTKKAVAMAAVAFNRMPETKEMIDWLMQTDEIFVNTGDGHEDRKGGNVAMRLIEMVDYDGHGNENSSHYNGTWVTNLSGAAEILAGYKLYPEVDLYKNPKFIKMFTAQMRTTLGGYYGAQIGDTGHTASQYQYSDFASAVTAFNITGDIEIAKMLWLYNKLYNGGDEENLRGTIFDAEPEGVADKVKEIVEKHGEFDLSGTMMAGFGFSALRAGMKYESASSMTADNTNRDFAMYYGSQLVHGHLGALNLYMSAFGLNVAPDLGYPEQTGNQPNRVQWVQVPISHNLVVVDEANQIRACKGTPYHFDSDGRVRVMDADSNAYPDVNEYRRSVIMVDVDDSVSYGVDFFHVNGGEDHVYSFHSQSDEVSAISGLENAVSYPTYTNEDGELIGTYAGSDVAFGPDPGGNEPNNVYPLGYTWLKNVRTYNSPEKDFTVEFKVKDWRNVLAKKQDIRLRMTMVSDEPMDEVSFVTGLPPQRSDNKQIGELEYVLVRNKGKNLDTTFTTVFEPYIEGEKYIKSIEKLSMQRDNASRPGLYDSFGAVKVEHINGRVDYVMYSTNTDALYTVTDGEKEIFFRGFAGVITLEGENIAYRYLNDGDILELSGEAIEDTIPAAYTGTVESFTTDLVFDNFITYTPASGETVDTELIKGKYVYVENDGAKNAVYEILDAEPDGDNIKLSLGNTTLIRSFVDAYDMDAGYVYNIAKGQTLRIPLSEVVDYSPVIDPIADTTTSAGSSITISFNAISPLGKELSFNNSTLPRGMSVNADAQTITWKPDSSQVGENHVALAASDGTLETAVHFTVTVYGSTTGSGSSSDNSGTSSEGAGSAGGGGGGGEAATTPDTDDEKKPETGETDEVENVRFIDLGNHAWAADSINALADDGIVKGTTAVTYSPANNITRADFALLLVRAFDLSSDDAENFADVSASDYFAPELAIARNTGIVNGIGDNKYAPRNAITRQDMMVIVYRALQKLNVGLSENIEPQYEDFNTVADYAKEAVSTLVGEGLVNGKSGRIAPTDYTTRAEVAVLIKRILDYVK